MKGTFVRPIVRKRNGEFTGYIVAYENTRELWSQSCMIRRLSHGVAMDDAIMLANDVETQHRQLNKNVAIMPIIKKGTQWKTL